MYFSLKEISLLKISKATAILDSGYCEELLDFVR
jgi:hypothetical protein